MVGTQPGGDRRASSPVIGDVLMVGVAVVAAVTVSVLALDAFLVLPGDAPFVSASADPYVVGPADTCGVNEVTLRHESGRVVAVEGLAIVLTLPDAGGATARLSGFPVTDGRLDDDNLGGNSSIVSRDCVGGALVEDDGQWSAGTPLSVQLNRSHIASGDRIRVRVVHEPSETNVTEKRLVAQ